jgi:hypothetical protein
MRPNLYLPRPDRDLQSRFRQTLSDSTVGNLLLAATSLVAIPYLRLHPGAVPRRPWS